MNKSRLVDWLEGRAGSQDPRSIRKTTTDGANYKTTSHREFTAIYNKKPQDQTIMASSTRPLRPRSLAFPKDWAWLRQGRRDVHNGPRKGDEKGLEGSISAEKRKKRKETMEMYPWP